MLKKHIKSGFKVLNNKIFKKTYPLKINYISTYNCDAKCVYCNIHQIKNFGELTTLQSKEMITELAKIGAEQITFVGGEPLVRKDIGELIDHAKKEGLLTTLTTNSNLTLKKIKDIENVDIYITCLNGPKIIHDNIRGKGNYDKVVNALKSKKIKAGKIITTILTKQNLNEIDFLVNKAKEFGCLINFQPVFHNELAKVENDELSTTLLTQKQVKEAFIKIKRLKKEGKPILNSYKSLNNFIEKGYSTFKKCHMGKLTITIDPKGNMFQCYKEVNHKTKNNGLQKGWSLAFKETKITNCKDCFYGCHIEDNFLFDLNIRAIINLLKISSKFK
ncbi:hypothetical protein C0585_01280 [Candidatus Woesearchaeota archaeon]|nr:MAG: hypothetical protein C0585_01280 [Candidatus Woesearchaeota archaeon]